MSILKGVEAHADEECDLHDKDCMLFASTAVANGNCIGIVNSTGMMTEIGKIQKQIQDASEEDDDTPLKIKLDEFGEALARVGCKGHLAQAISLEEKLHPTAREDGAKLDAFGEALSRVGLQRSSCSQAMLIEQSCTPLQCTAREGCDCLASFKHPTKPWQWGAAAIAWGHAVSTSRPQGEALL